MPSKTLLAHYKAERNSIKGKETIKQVMSAAHLESLLKRDRFIILTGLLVLAGVSWLYLIHLGRSMNTDMSMPMVLPWTTADFVLTFVMWAVMMVAMMLPSAAPMILTFALVQRRRAEQSTPFVPTSVFLVGYLVAWTVFSALATLEQSVLHAAAVWNPHTQAVAPGLGGVVLIVAGAYQLTPAKNVCLRHCRSPLDFLTRHWREGKAGAFVMGLHHGAFCLGCCWMLMALLFVAGVMNLLWVATIAAFVLIEKILPQGTLARFASAGILLAAGLVWLGRALGGG